VFRFENTSSWIDGIRGPFVFFQERQNICRMERNSEETGMKGKQNKKRTLFLLFIP
jgi:hypothetical protein